MDQSRTVAPPRVRVRSAFDPRWIIAFLFGLVLSVGYYALLIWAGLWAVKAVLGWMSGG